MTIKPRQVSAAAFLLLSFVAACLAKENAASPAAKSQAKPSKAATATPATYVVQRGETIAVIARRFGIAPRDLVDWNGLPRPVVLKPGQILRLTPPVPAAATASKPPAAAPAASEVAAPPPGSASTPVVGAEQTDGRPTEPEASASPGEAPAARASSAEPPTSEPRKGTTVVTEADAEARANSQRQELETLRQTTLNLIKLLVETGVLTQEKAEQLIAQAKRDAAQEVAAKTVAETKVIRVPYVPQHVRDEIKEELRQEVVAQAKDERWAVPNAVPAWVDRFTFNGDLRLRYQGNYLSESNAPAVDIQGTNQGNGLALLNTTDSFDFWRYQLRFGADIKIDEKLLAGVRLASGNTGNPVSLNQTLGNSFNKNAVVIDLAYLRGDPAKWVTLWGGRMPNPFVSTDLIWYDQLNLDGLATTLRTNLGTGVKAWTTLGAFPVENVDCTSAISVATCGSNKWLYAAQAAFESALKSESRLKVALTYYDWSRYEGRFNDPVVNPADRTFVPKFAQKGNTYFNIVTNGGNPLLGLASKFELVNLTGSLDLGVWDPVRVVLTGDLAKNIGYDRAEILKRTGGLVDQEARTLGWYARLSVGYDTINKWGDWQAYAGYKYIQRDALVDGYNDPDFHFGGTDTKGYLLGLSYGIAKSTFARLRWLSANSIDGPPFAWDVLQLDVVARF